MASEDEPQSLFLLRHPVNADDLALNFHPSNVIILGESRELPFEESWATKWVSASGPWFQIQGSHGSDMVHPDTKATTRWWI